MKILLLNGSPKAEKSDTLTLSRAFLEGMKADYKRVDLITRKIEPCLGCFCCWRVTPGICVRQDDAALLLSEIEDVDLVIWSMPLYCYGMPSHVKALVDRLLPLSTPAQRVDENGHTYHPARKERQAVHMLIAGCGFPDYEGNFDPLVLQFRKLFGMDTPMILCAESPMLNVAEAQQVVLPYLDAIRKAGEEYGREGRISEESMQVLSKPMLDPEVYRKICSGEMQN